MSSALLSLLTSFAGGMAVAGKGVTGATLNANTPTTTPLTAMVNGNPSPTGNVPKAGVNWILFDEQFRPVANGYDAVNTAGDYVKTHTLTASIIQNGYLYVYCSDESDVDVYFDNLQVVHNRGPLVEETHYYPFGLTMAGISSSAAGSLENKKDFHGKETQNKEFSDGSGLELYDFGAREYDPQIGRWWTVDPLAYKRDWLSPYNFVQNNPMIRIDPNGETDFTLNKKTGEVKQIGDQNDAPDRILKTNKNGDVKYRKNGEARVAIGGIEKGILNNGQNFQNKDQVISVGGKGQPSVAGVKSFTLQLSEYVGKEIKGFSYSANGSGNVTDMVLGKYINNEVTKSYGYLTAIINKYGDNFIYKNVLQQFHTHPNGELGATESAPQLSDDVIDLQNAKPLISNASFIILYRMAGQEKPAEFDYTYQYTPKR